MEAFCWFARPKTGSILGDPSFHAYEPDPSEVLFIKELVKQSGSGLYNEQGQLGLCHFVATYSIAPPESPGWHVEPAEIVSGKLLSIWLGREVGPHRWDRQLKLWVCNFP